MKKTFIFCMSLMLCLLLTISRTAFSDTAGEAITRATVKVIPSITVGSNPTGADMGEIQTGLFTGTFLFRIDSNIQYVNIQISATKLYKAGWPGEVAPVPIANSEGVEIDPDVTLSQTVAYETEVTINGLDGSQFAMLTFESNQDGRFSSDIDVTVTWDQDDPTKPEGNYRGFVTLYAVIVP